MTLEVSQPEVEAYTKDVDSIVADPDAYTKEELAALRSQIVSNLEQAWEISGGSEDQLTATMMQISQVVAKQFKVGD